MSKGKILVVDDDRLVLATLVHGLSEAGYEVLDADNGDEAILLARQHRPSLALLDIRMEGKSGFDVAEYLRDYCHIPFMFLSAFSDDATVARIKALGAVAYLVKPLDVRQIVPAVEAAFEQPRPARPAEAPRTPDSTSPSRWNDLADEPTAVLDKDGLHAISLAVGMVMQKFGVDRHHAMDRVRAMAEREGCTLQVACERMIGTHEVMKHA
jgi:response regulator NasT